MSDSDDEEEYTACMDAMVRHRLARRDTFLTVREESAFIAGWEAAEAWRRLRGTEAAP